MTDADRTDVVPPASVVTALLETVSDAVVIQDTTGSIRRFSAAAERVFGVGSDTVAGGSFAMFLDDETALRWPELLRRVVGGERADLPRLTLQRLDGLVVHASAHLSPLLDHHQVVVGSCLVVRDHTEEVVAQQTLAAAEERVRRSETLAGAGSFVIDAANHSEQWSAGMYAIHRMSAGEFDGTESAHLAVVHRDDRDAVAEAIHRALTEGREVEQDHRLGSHPGVWLFMAVGPLRDGTGRIVGVTGFCQDITARREGEAAAREALAAQVQLTDELRRLDSLKDDFLATVSHELRTPLTSIRGYSSLLGKQHPELAQLVEPIERNGADMSRMVETLLDFSRLQAGQVAVRPQPVDLHDVTERVLASFANQSKGLRLRNDVAPGFTVTADPDALQRILGNLVGNACRYASGGTTATVSALREPSGATLVSVIDDGPGVPAEHLGRLFERFFQVPGTTTRRGTGIGLAIVAEYVGKLGGQTWCESVEGRGAAFHVRLP